MRPKDLTYLKDISQIDWARLAAYIDGEGCITIASVKGAASSRRRIFYVELTVTNTDLRLTAWLKDTFGGCVYISRRNSDNAKWAPSAAWNVAARHAATLLDYCLPYFIIKREQADVALAFQRTILADRRYGCLGRPQALVDEQRKMQEQLQTLKGTSSRAKRAAVDSTTH